MPAVAGMERMGQCGAKQGDRMTELNMAALERALDEERRRREGAERAQQDGAVQQRALGR